LFILNSRDTCARTFAWFIHTTCLVLVLVLLLLLPGIVPVLLGKPDVFDPAEGERERESERERERERERQEREGEREGERERE